MGDFTRAMAAQVEEVSDSSSPRKGAALADSVEEGGAFWWANQIMDYSDCISSIDFLTSGFPNTTSGINPRSNEACDSYLTNQDNIPAQDIIMHDTSTLDDAPLTIIGTTSPRDAPNFPEKLYEDYRFLPTSSTATAIVIRGACRERERHETRSFRCFKLKRSNFNSSAFDIPQPAFQLFGGSLDHMYD
ncbi:hypothetical protein KSP40_PGU001873 [Platanthera guangdongensis]|uniref:Uncharacterized protein n=1 Tax=Platanthera guangdongensis TaxID=2320717 RepID=A0ABR2N204_9ASPA